MPRLRPFGMMRCMSEITPVSSVLGHSTGGPTLMLQPSDPPAPVNAPRIVSRLEVRLWSLFTCILCFSMLGIGLYLTPSPDGFGKHAGLFGGPPCGFYTVTGYPCPTCGCTTAVSHFAHGHFLTSLITQPFGFAVALVAMIAGTLALAGLVTGRWRGPSMFWISWYWRLWVFGGIALLVFGWVYKIFRVRMGYP